MRYFIVPIFVLLSVPAFGLAHPHVFIAVKAEEHVSDDVTLKNVIVQWNFDGLSSEIILDDCDENKNGQIDEKEVPILKRKYGKFYGKDKFFCDITIDEKEFTGAKFSIDDAFMDGKNACLFIDITLDIPFRPASQKINLYFHDPSAYTAFWGTNKIKFELPGMDGGDASIKRSVSTQAETQQGFKAWFFAKQGQFNAKVYDLISRAKEDLSAKMYALLFLIAVAYGLFHAAGPGHGKTFVIGFFLQRQSRLIHAPIFAGLIAAIHTSTAVAIALIFTYILTGYEVQMERQKAIANISFYIAIFIILLGLWLLAWRIFFKHSSSQPDAKKGMLRTALVAGIIPCPLSIVIILMGISRGLLVPCLTAVAGIALGMALLLTIAGAATILSKNKLRSISEKRGGVSTKVYKTLDYVGAILIILMGLALAFLNMPRI